MKADAHRPMVCGSCSSASAAADGVQPWANIKMAYLGFNLGDLRFLAVRPRVLSALRNARRPQGGEPCRPKSEGETAVRTTGLLTAGRNPGDRTGPSANC